MSVTTTAVKELLTGDQIEDLFVRPVVNTSVAGRVCTIIRTNSHRVSVPSMAKGPTATWVEELQEIPTSDVSFSSVVIEPRKIAGIVPLSSEAQDDTSADIAGLIGERLTVETTKGVDAAFLTKMPAPAPEGLAALEGMTVVNGGDNVFSTLDAFVEAVANADDAGTPITSWVMSPDTRTKLATIKAATGSNTYLLSDANVQPSYRTIEGAPVITSSHIPEGVVYGIPRNRALMVIRRDVTVETSQHSLWTRDGISVRSIMRIGFGFTDPASIVKITTATA